MQPLKKNKIKNPTSSSAGRSVKPGRRRGFPPWAKPELTGANARSGVGGVRGRRQLRNGRRR